MNRFMIILLVALVLAVSESSATYYYYYGDEGKEVFSILCNYYLKNI